MLRGSPLVNHSASPLRLEPVNGRVGGDGGQHRARHRSTSPASHELLSARSSTTAKPKTISFSSSLENVSLDDKELALAPNGSAVRDQATPSPSIFNGHEHSPVFKSGSIGSSKTNSEKSKNCRREGLDSLGRSSVKIDRPQQIDQRFSLRKKDRNNNQEKARKPSSSTISSGGPHGSSSNENSLFIPTEHHKLDPDRLAVSGSIVSKEINAMKLRSSVDRRLAQKRQSRVIKMLAILVLEFFTCWCPLHIINLISLYNPKLVYQAIGG